jgi:hypothetical protein
MDAAVKALEERIGFDQAKGLWDRRSREYTIAFAISASASLGLIAAVIWSAFIYRQDVMDYFFEVERRLTAGAGPQGGEIAQAIATFSRLAFITVPLALLVWVVRILLRFNMRSMLLMDDARQRVTMLNTYLFMVSRDVAVKEDRATILEALFRRAPGHGSEPVEPSLTIVNEALGATKSP